MVDNSNIRGYSINMTGKEIKELRQKLGLSQQAFATKVGVSMTSVSHWEVGKSKPIPIIVEKLNKIKEESNSENIIHV
jgi:DNA-binding transcriptional regulator YiaG